MTNLQLTSQHSITIREKNPFVITKNKVNTFSHIHCTNSSNAEKFLLRRSTLNIITCEFSISTSVDTSATINPLVFNADNSLLPRSRLLSTTAMKELSQKAFKKRKLVICSIARFRNRVPGCNYPGTRTRFQLSSK